MSENDPDWSVFWSHSGYRAGPPSPTAIFAGKHVAEDPDVVRSPETLGIIVFEAGHGTIAGVEYEARLGPDTVAGIDNVPPFTYDFLQPFEAPPQVLLTVESAIDGINGGWAYAYGAPAATASQLFVVIDEDQVLDAERGHTTEQVAYVAFGAPTVFPASACGDGNVDPGEICDDGNTAGGDGCSADCLSDESCGNGILDPGEACDDGNTTGGDGCSGSCLSLEICGNGILDPGEVCDDGNTAGGDGCSADCTSDESCGNGVLDPGEACDDGNTSGGDGCS
nr:hypothetical protein [Actinomycetota bacterium]